MTLEELSETDQDVFQSLQDAYTEMRTKYSEAHDNQFVAAQLNQAAAALSQFGEGMRNGNLEMKMFAATLWPFASPFPVFSTKEEYLIQGAMFLLCEASRIRRQIK